MVTDALTILLLPLLAFVLIVFVTRQNQIAVGRRCPSWPWASPRCWRCS